MEIHALFDGLAWLATALIALALRRFAGDLFPASRRSSGYLAALIVGGQINPALAANNVRVIKDTHGKTSQLTADDLEALILYLLSLDAKPQ